MRHFDQMHATAGTYSRSVERAGLARRSAIADERPTPRELEVEGLLCRGYSKENIAAILGCSVSTVSAHAMRLYRKRRVHTQVGLLLAYLERKGVFVFPQEGSECALHEQATLEAAQ